MRYYVITTGLIFAAVVIAHVMRLFAEGAHMAEDPFFLIMTLLAAGLAGWAWTLLRRRSGDGK